MEAISIFLLLKSFIGAYKAGGSIHPTSSVEVYLPWNDTWIELPQLPGWQVPPKWTVKRMDLTRLMSLTSRAQGTQLFLLGGSHTEWNAGKGLVTKEVSQLRWNSGSRNYSWDDEDVRALGR